MGGNRFKGPEVGRLERSLETSGTERKKESKDLCVGDRCL